MNRRKLQLEFELEHYIDRVTSGDVIDTMTFKSNVGEPISVEHISDITSTLAVTYTDKAKCLNVHEKQELRDELRRTEVEVNRLVHYVSLLDGKQADVVRMRCFEGKTISQVVEILKISESSIKNIFKAAVSTLTEMYNLIIF